MPLTSSPFYQSFRKTPPKVLDTGCGFGDDVRQFLRDGFQAMGIDYNPYCFKAGFDYYKDEHFVRDNFKTANVLDIPAEDQSYDYVYSSSIIHSLKSKEEIVTYLSEVFRVLRNGGVIFGRTREGKRNEERNIFVVTRSELTEMLYRTGFSSCLIRKKKDDDYSPWAGGDDIGPKPKYVLYFKAVRSKRIRK